MERLAFVRRGVSVMPGKCSRSGVTTFLSTISNRVLLPVA